VHVGDDTKPLVSLLLFQGTIKYFLSKNQKIVIRNNGKRKVRDRTNSLAFLKRK